MKAIVGLLAAGLFVTTSFAAGVSKAPTEETEKLTWYTDLKDAHKLSDESGKPIFGFFTGSDWCGWCMRLQREVFAKDAFVEWANDNVILLELDFPKRKVLPDEIKAQNQNLQRAFKVTGYPTVWLFRSTMDAETEHFSLAAIGKLGYPRGAEKGKEEVKFIETANGILASEKKAN